MAIEAGITTAEPSVAQKKGVNKEENNIALRGSADYMRMILSI